MSSLRNEAILETIFEEVMEELEANELICNSLLFGKELEEFATTIAQQRFEDLQ